MNVSHLESGVTIGFCGSMAVKELLTLHPEWFVCKENEIIDHKFLSTQVVPKLYELAVKNGLVDEESLKYGRSEMEGTFLIAEKDRLYYIDSDFSVTTVSQYAVIGNGAVKSLYYVQQLPDEKDKKAMILKAMRMSQRYSTTVSAPFFFTDTLSKGFDREDR